jgi:benzoylformate decarboxylase
VPAGAALYQLIDDPNVAAWTPGRAAVVGNVRLGLLDLLARAAPDTRPLPEPRPRAPRAEPSPVMSVAFALQTLAEVRDPNDVVVEEAPSSRPVMQRYLPFTKSNTFFTMASGGLGYGMPAAVGVALALPDRKVIGLIGDGSSMYSIQAIYSAVQMRLPITFVILNNQRYAALQEFAPVFGFASDDPVQGTDLPGLDFVSLARGMGCKGLRVTDAAELAEKLKEALEAGEPRLVEVVVA